MIAACLNFQFLEVFNLPYELREEYAKLLLAVTIAPGADFVHSMTASINGMSTEKMQDAVARILRINDALRVLEPWL